MAPGLIGKDLVYAVKKLSQAHLNPRVLAQKEDDGLPAGTIISQSPAAGQLIKSNQPIYLVLSKKPPAQTAPHCIKLSDTQVGKKLRHQRIHPHHQYVPSSKEPHICIGQFPSPNSLCADKSMIIYYAHEPSPYLLFPDLRKKKVTTVTQFLRTHNIKPTIEHLSTKGTHHTCTHCRVVKQKPIPATVVTDENLPKVTLYVA